ncbi:alpha-L-rhamnosidase [Dactylonectria estremocensis]|uniref:Alpha-L-rhamnosidase n=1 Tax=Dactylonectria estremocensis TaxID=1079267 RepID=A0A9P9ISZ4_9HYPO|nr:alpha-L-rhamnosidase [Dactylonectria estremocensis]
MANVPNPPIEQVVPAAWNQDFEKISEELCPSLARWDRFPQRLVAFSPDEESYFGIKATPSPHAMDEFPALTWGKGDEFVLDFGVHMVGFVSFKLDSVGDHMDAPCRLRLTFGESPLDVTMDMDKVETWISTAWLPDEVINVDMCPETVVLPRRYSFRFLRVQVIDTSRKFKVSFSSVKCECVSAIGPDHELDAVEFANPLLRDIDHCSISTLRDCMQTVFEDGPRRDRRLWSGDLRLQALANYRTLRDFGLVKRCIYQFAAVVRSDGSLPACIFEKPRLEASTDYIVDYDALFGAIVLDYVVESGDVAAGQSLWPAVLTCTKRALSHINPDTHIFETDRTKFWKFLDWAPTLDRSAGSHGVLLYCLKAINKLATALGKEPPHLDMVEKMTTAATHFISKDNVFISGPESQISYASASWLVLAEAFPEETARAALLNTIAHPDAVKPLTPYLWHHVCDALLTVGCFDKCLEIINNYWGGMIRAGADTFWECYDPEDPRASPYGDVRNNSFCHAWSCTPTYLLRGKLLNAVNGKVAGKITMGQLDDRWVQRSIN